MDKVDLIPILTEITRCFDLLNAKCFDSKLEPLVVTVQQDSTKKSHASNGCSGWFTTQKEWSNADKGYHEINICAEYLRKGFALPNCWLETLLHEMCHYYNATVTAKQDCSRGGTYHNKVFKETAESVGLVVTKSDKYGFAHTRLSDDMLKWAEINGFHPFDLSRIRAEERKNESGEESEEVEGEEEGNEEKASKSHSIKYVCPCCVDGKGKSLVNARTTKPTKLICGICMHEMEIES